MDIGTQLRTSREALGISLALLAEKTRVQPKILAAIELNDLRAIPPKPFGRGFVRAYADEVGLDPDRTVQDYFRQFAAVVETPAAPKPRLETGGFGSRGRILTAGGLGLAVLAGLFAFQSFGAADKGATTDAVVGTAGTGSAPTAAAPSAEPVPESVAAPEGLMIGVRAERACWVTATADGKRVIYQLMPPGATQVIRATEQVTLRAGDAGAVRLTVNGRDAGPLGDAGEVRNARITLANAATFGAQPPR